jgi:hypothetical protein
MDAPYDEPVRRPKPERDALALALTDLRDGESPLERYVRQEWETAAAATLVALGAWRKIWPNETRYSLSEDEWETARRIELLLAEANHLLSTLSPTMLGPVADAVAQGDMTADEGRRSLDQARSAAGDL